MDKDYEIYLKLKEDINKYNYHYYEKNESLISDKEFDDLLVKLSEMEQKFPHFKDNMSQTSKVGGFVSEKFSKVKHTTSMLSLSNTYNIGDIKDFNNRIQKILNTSTPI